MGSVGQERSRTPTVTEAVAALRADIYVKLAEAKGDFAALANSPAALATNPGRSREFVLKRFARLELVELRLETAEDTLNKPTPGAVAEPIDVIRMRRNAYLDEHNGLLKYLEGIIKPFRQAVEDFEDLAILTFSDDGELHRGYKSVVSAREYEELRAMQALMLNSAAELGLLLGSGEVRAVVNVIQEDAGTVTVHIERTSAGYLLNGSGLARIYESYPKS